MPLLLLKYWKYIALAVFIIGVAIYHSHLTSTIESQKETIAEQKLQIDILGETLQKQNDAVDQMKKDADARVAAGKVAVEAAKKQAQTYKQRADALRKSQPKFPADLCLSADDLINQELAK
jgi:predicted Holliday junction resolvase-like endonuclease